ncbi:ABC transporter ATP-binding protein [Planosporangium sp. 12N6]|uniref:ABC transporter ATP-binding protein n=1 Tax=Planosporangium spinosum TaxID=3402278 RepID=UPI003CEA0193
MSVIAVDRLTKRYGALTAVDELSFTAEAATIVGFLGPNGSGKTTTLRMLLGMVAPTSGTALIDGVPYARLASPVRHVGALLEARATHPGRSARDHLRVLATAAGIGDRRVDEVLDLVGLTAAARRRVREFSLGMHQRLGLAAALLGDPPLLVLDEPANGLDPEGIRWMRQFLRDRRAEGRTVLVSSHVLAEVAQVADKVVIIAHGRLVTEAPLARLLAEHGAAVRVRTPEPARLAALLAAHGATVRPDTDDELVVGGLPAAELGRLAVTNQVVVTQITDQVPDLESLFLDLTSSAGAIR